MDILQLNFLYLISPINNQEWIVVRIIAKVKNHEEIPTKTIVFGDFSDISL